ncbi:MAG: pentapeptide repeat-containing protein [Cyanobacteriota bacterium]
MSLKLAKFLIAALLVISLEDAVPVEAADHSHVRRLLETKECSGCDLSRADLSLAILVNANLMGANLKGANLSGADLTRANLSEADLSGANLNQALLTSANLDQTNLTGASTNGSRGLPVIAVLPSIPYVSIPERRPRPAISISPAQRPQPISIQTPPLPPLPLIPLLPSKPTPPSQAETPLLTIAQLTQTTAQLTEARNYLRAHWRPPSNLTQTLEYILTLNADGSISRILPLAKVAGDYLDRTGIPLLGEPFVSPIDGEVKSTIRVVFEPDGNVQVLLERQVV